MFHTPELCAHPWNSKESSVGGPGGEGFLWGVMSWISPTGTWHTAVLHGCRDAYHSLGCNSTCSARGKGVKESRGIICTNVTQLLKAGSPLSLCSFGIRPRYVKWERASTCSVQFHLPTFKENIHVYAGRSTKTVWKYVCGMTSHLEEGDEDKNRDLLFISYRVHILLL